MEERFNDFLDNHWPHMVSRVARLEGAMWVIVGGMAVLIGLMAALVAKTL